MAELSTETGLGTALNEIMTADRIEPGKDASYELCKILWEYHPLGGKMVEKPINMALFKPRVYKVDDDPDGKIVKQFQKVWTELGVTEKIRNLHFNKRAYGAAALGVGTKSKASNIQLPGIGELSEDDIFINVWDPLCVAGSMVSSQDPNSRKFQQPDPVLSIQGQNWHSSRTIKEFNGAPIYLSYQSSAFGFTGRSVFERTLYPLKSFLQTMQTDNMVSEKAGLLIVKENQQSSFISGIMSAVSSVKRSMLKRGVTNNVLSIGQQDGVESLNLMNIDGSMKTSRENIISNIAMGCDTPAKLIQDEAFALGFSDGTEDSKAIAQYIDSVRQEMEPSVIFLERIIQYAAWNKDFFNSLKAEYPDVIDGDFETNFHQWRNSFTASWAELTEESPESKQKSESHAVERISKLLETLIPNLDPVNRSTLIEWAANLINTLEMSEDTPLNFDYEALAKYMPPEPTQQDNQGGFE